MLAVKAEPLPRRRGPQPGDDLQLLAEPVEPLGQRRERDAQVTVFLLDPGGADAEFGPAAAHRVHGGDRDGERPGPAVRGRGHERAQPHSFGLNGETGQRGPRIGRTVTGVVRFDPLVVVGPEEGVEAGFLGGPGQRQDLVVAGTVVRFEQDAQSHAGIPSRGKWQATTCPGASRRREASGAR